MTDTPNVACRIVHHAHGAGGNAWTVADHARNFYEVHSDTPATAIPNERLERAKGAMTDAMFSIERGGTAPALAARLRSTIAELGDTP